MDFKVPAKIAVFISRNRLVSTGFYKGFSVSFLVLDGKKVLYLEVYFEANLAR